MREVDWPASGWSCDERARNVPSENRSARRWACLEYLMRFKAKKWVIRCAHTEAATVTVRKKKSCSESDASGAKNQWHDKSTSNLLLNNLRLGQREIIGEFVTNIKSRSSPEIDIDTHLVDFLLVSAAGAGQCWALISLVSHFFCFRFSQALAKPHQKHFITRGCTLSWLQLLRQSRLDDSRCKRTLPRPSRNEKESTRIFQSYIFLPEAGDGRNEAIPTSHTAPPSKFFSITASYTRSFSLSKNYLDKRSVDLKRTNRLPKAFAKRFPPFQTSSSLSTQINSHWKFRENFQFLQPKSKWLFKMNQLRIKKENRELVSIGEAESFSSLVFNYCIVCNGQEKESAGPQWAGKFWF